MKPFQSLVLGLCVGAMVMAFSGPMMAAPGDKPMDGKSQATPREGKARRTTTSGTQRAQSNTEGIPPSNEVPASGVYRLEAEYYDQGGEGLGYHKSNKHKIQTAKVQNKDFRPDDPVSTDNAGGPGHIAVTHWEGGDWLQYTLKVAKAGCYELRFRYARGEHKEGELEVSVVGQDTPVKVALPSTQYPWTYEQATAVMNLPTGQCKLRISSQHGQFNLDCVDIVASTTVGNNGASWVMPRRGVLRLDAGNFDELPAGATGTKAPAGNGSPRPGATVNIVKLPGNGTAVADFVPGESLAYSLNIASDGNYKLRISHAGGEGVVRLTIDGTDRSGAVNLPATSSASDFQTTEQKIRAPRGFHTLKLESVSGRASIASMELEKDPVVQVAKPDPNGKGSYAAEPPEEAYDASRELFHQVWDREYRWIDRPKGEPIPSNHWWTNVIAGVNPLTGSLWPYPQRITVNPEGLAVTGYTRLSERPGNVGVDGGSSLTVRAADGGKLSNNSLLSFGDWSLRFRVDQEPGKSMDVTIARGIPMTWIEFKGIEPAISAPDQAEMQEGADGAATLVVPKEGLPWAIFAPDGTRFTKATKGYTVSFAGADKYLVIAVLPEPKAAKVFAKYAWSVPTNTRFDYKYDPAAGTVTTDWTIESRPLRAGAGDEFIQGWLPHNYRDVVSSPKLHPEWSYACLNGPIRLSAGKNFRIVQPAPNLALAWPTPRKTGGKGGFDAARMAKYLEDYAADEPSEPKYGGDTYFGMKPIQQWVECALAARQMNHASQATFLKAAQTALADWFTYTPGEKLHYFASYPGTGALIGFNPSFGSEHFTDNHFHYGYHIASAGVVSLLDPAWGKDYAAMATLVAKQYANWDRGDKRFPYFRTFEPWVGHSYAGGHGDPPGTTRNRSPKRSSRGSAWCCWAKPWATRKCLPPA